MLYLRRLPIKTKVKILAVVPLLVIVILMGLSFSEAYYNKKQLEDTNKVILFNQKISQLIHETQKERGASAGYLNSRSNDLGQS